MTEVDEIAKGLSPGQVRLLDQVFWQYQRGMDAEGFPCGLILRGGQYRCVPKLLELGFIEWEWLVDMEDVDSRELWGVILVEPKARLAARVLVGLGLRPHEDIPLETVAV